MPVGREPINESSYSAWPYNFLLFSCLNESSKCVSGIQHYCRLTYLSCMRAILDCYGDFRMKSIPWEGGYLPDSCTCWCAIQSVARIMIQFTLEPDQYSDTLLAVMINSLHISLRCSAGSWVGKFYWVPLAVEWLAVYRDPICLYVRLSLWNLSLGSLTPA